MMNTVTNFKQRTYLDPIHGPIQLNLKDEAENLIAQLIDTEELQRLRRIRQMGTASYTFHGAEHTRFGHSLGAFFVAKKMIVHLTNYYPQIENYKSEIMISALLHDVGHGPFSHTSEKITDFTHEDITKKIIEGETNINTILKNQNKDLPNSISKILEHKANPKFICQLISSYIDCDRLDYLHRDSYYVGVPYGLTGSERIISSLDIDSDCLVIRESVGLDPVIHYLQARYSMYQQIYQHKKNLACDFMLRKIFQRIKETKPKNIFQPVNNWLTMDKNDLKTFDIDLYLQVDDYSIISNFHIFASDQNTDKILGNLSRSYIYRKLFKSLEFRPDIKPEQIKELDEKAKQIAVHKGLEAEYYVGIEQSSSKPYEPYQIKNSKTSNAIFIKQKNGKVKELSEISDLVRTLSEKSIIKTCLVFSPHIEDDIYSIRGIQELFI